MLKRRNDSLKLVSLRKKREAQRKVVGARRCISKKVMLSLKRVNRD